MKLIVFKLGNSITQFYLSIINKYLENIYIYIYIIIYSEVLNSFY